jgi:hypothetical protein
MSNNNQGLKLKTWVKLAAFVAATFSLSLFFEGWRQIHQNPNLQNILLFAVGIFSTIFLLWLNALWIYLEEKSKGTLAKRVVHFDKLEKLFVRQPSCLNKVDQVRDDSRAGGVS